MTDDLLERVQALMDAAPKVGKAMAAEMIVAAAELAFMKRQEAKRQALEEHRRQLARERQQRQRDRDTEASRTSRVTPVTPVTVRDEIPAGSSPGSGSSPDPDPRSPSAGACDPTTPANLLAVMTGTAGRKRPEIGIYDPGPWADREAAAFFERTPQARQQPEEIRARIEAFFAEDKFKPWTARKFFAEFNGLSARAGPPKKPPFRAPEEFRKAREAT